VVFGTRELRIIATGTQDVLLNKCPAREHFEFVATMRSSGTAAAEGEFGFVLLDASGAEAARLHIGVADERFRISGDSQPESFELPLEYQPGNLHRFGFTKLGDQLLLDLDMKRLGSVPIAVKEACVGIYCSQSEIAVESVRFTVLTGTA
jgi:hypothetical protein